MKSENFEIFYFNVHSSSTFYADYEKNYFGRFRVTQDELELLKSR
jgi:hypothetical protein